MAEEARERERHRWNENSKVYTRKFYKKASKTHQNNTQVTQCSNVDSAVVNENNGVQGLQQTGVNGDAPSPQHQPQPQSQPEAVQHEQQSLVGVEPVSNDSSSLHRHEEGAPNGHDGSLANGLVRPVVTRAENRVVISLSAVKSIEDFEELKRKLLNELEEVRSSVKKLEEKEGQLSVYSNGFGIGSVGAGISAGYGCLPCPTRDRISNGGGRRVNSNMNSVGFTDSRPLKKLSVSVVDNHHYGIGDFVVPEKRTPKANQYYRNSDFVLGAEKFPPPEKKLKSNGGKRHGNGEMDYGLGMDKQMFRSCSNLLQKLMKHKFAWVFNIPVDVKKLGLHDYFDIIKHPMDLGTVKTRLNKNWYKSPREFAEDVRLTFHNALTYNPKGQDVHFMAEQLLEIFEEKWVTIEHEYNHRWRFETVRAVGFPTPTSRKYAVPMYAPAPPAPREVTIPVEPRPKPTYPMGRTPVPKKPKAKDPYKRDMTFEEKQRLSTNLQSLPPERLDAIVQIIKKRNSALSQHDDEIEVDIDKVDAETLWELDRFVTNYKKSLSKNKRKAELALQARAEAGRAAQQTNAAPVSAVVHKETQSVDERNVAPTRIVQEHKHTDNASDSSSSSSSSSESGSSSSDSDSHSSSSSGSDKGD